MNMYFRLQRLLIRRANPGKIRNLALPRLLIQPLRIPLLRHLHWNINPTLHKRHSAFSTWPLCFVQLPRYVPVPAVGADEARDGDGAAICEELRDLSDAANV